MTVGRTFLSACSSLHLPSPPPSFQINLVYIMYEDRKSNLQKFVDWSKAHITGDEKGEAQIFLDRLFQAFSQKGCLDVGGTTEFRIRKSNEDGGGTSFADFVWKPIVLIEMKKRGTDLSRHY